MGLVVGIRVDGEGGVEGEAHSGREIRELERVMGVGINGVLPVSRSLYLTDHTIDEARLLTWPTG